MTYKLPNLPYSYNALEPLIDAKTMRIHHTQHHQEYINHLNKLLRYRHGLAAIPLENIVADISMVSEEIRQQMRNYAGAHLNHSLFWQTIGPKSSSNQEPQDELKTAIIKKFYRISSLQEAFISCAMARFGSGWAWLGLDLSERLEVFSTPNQDSPIMLGYKPILGVDLWEHAYYLKYQNNKIDYLTAWWKLINWAKVSQIYEMYDESLAQSS